MSIASQNAQQKFPFPYDDVFDGVVATIPDSGFRLKSQDRLIGRVTASTGTSFFSRGENVTIIVEKIDKGSTVVGIESALKVGMNVAGAKNFDRLIESLSSYLWAKTQIPSTCGRGSKASATATGTRTERGCGRVENPMSAVRAAAQSFGVEAR